MPEGRPFEIKEIEGKGMGVVATRDIKAGELILKETPLVTHSNGAPTAVLEQLVSTLSESDKDAYNSLYVNPSLAWLPRIMAVFKTNAIGLGENADIGGVFVEGSRFNHSCRPNCSHMWDKKFGVQWLIAGREIKQGEEICIFYNVMREPREVRQRWLKEMFGFDCNCEACSASPEEVLASDSRRKVIFETYDSRPQLVADPVILIKAVNKALRLLKEEGISLLGPDLALQPLGACLAYGDAHNADLWIDKVLELEATEAGRWSSHYKEVESWKGNPELSPQWKVFCKRGHPSTTLAGPE